MTDLIIIYDPKREIAALVNPETRQGWGPAVIGEGADEALQAFIEAAPFDLTLMSPDTATLAFEGFLEGLQGGAAPPPAETPDSPLVGVDGNDADVAAAAVREAAEAAGSPPDPAPADTDPAAAPAAPMMVVECYNCGGTGSIEFGGDEPPQRCNMCQGTGKIAQAA